MSDSDELTELNADGMTKVKMETPDKLYTETLWATPLGDGLYRLENSPFFAYGVSWEDVVEARRENTGDFLEFQRCVSKSGNRTLRVIFEDSFLSNPNPQIVLDALHEMGCSYEGMQPKMVSLNIPPEVDLAKVTEYLVSQSKLKWEYADPTYDQMQQTIT